MRYQILPLVAAALLGTASLGAAQQGAPAPKLDVGEWSGIVTDPGGQTVDVFYDVAYAGDTLKINIRAGDHGTFATYDASFEAGKISFRFRPGPEVLCVLEKKDLLYAGTCTADDGSAATLEMSPPQKAKG